MTSKTSLRDIALNINKQKWYLTDKAGGFKAVEKYGYYERCHELAELYDYILSDLRDEEINLLEVGVAKGGSIKMWSEYFEKGNIYGVDVMPYLERIGRPFNDPRIEIFWENAYCEAFTDKLKNLGLSFDVVLDDGPHTLESQLYFVENYVDLVKPGGHIIIEDIGGTDKAIELHEALLSKVSFSFIVDRTVVSKFGNEITLVGIK
jgi:SAM-dependent methyltransferase